MSIALKKKLLQWQKNKMLHNFSSIKWNLLFHVHTASMSMKTKLSRNRDVFNMKKTLHSPIVKLHFYSFLFVIFFNILNWSQNQNYSPKNFTPSLIIEKFCVGFYFHTVPVNEKSHTRDSSLFFLLSNFFFTDHGENAPSA